MEMEMDAEVEYALIVIFRQWLFSHVGIFGGVLRYV